MRPLKHLAPAVLVAAGLGFTSPSFAQQPTSPAPPNIDRIATEGAIFPDYCGQQSCTADRAAFITGQSPMRTGLSGSTRSVRHPARTSGWNHFGHQV
jgi:arylsulfatase A-like enzyme